MRNLTIAGLLALLLALPGSASAFEMFEQRADICAAEMDARLRALNIAESDIEDITYKRVKQLVRGSNRVIGFEAWVKPTYCDGSIIVRTRRSCALLDEYASGDCQLAQN